MPLCRLQAPVIAPLFLVLSPPRKRGSEIEGKTPEGVNGRGGVRACACVRACVRAYSAQHAEEKKGEAALFFAQAGGQASGCTAALRTA